MKYIAYFLLALLLATGIAGWNFYKQKSADWERFASNFQAKKTMDPAGALFSFRTVEVVYPGGLRPLTFPSSINIIVAETGLYMNPAWPAESRALIPYPELVFQKTENIKSWFEVKIKGETVQLAVPSRVYAEMQDNAAYKNGQNHPVSGQGFASLK